MKKSTKTSHPLDLFLEKTGFNDNGELDETVLNSLIVLMKTLVVKMEMPNIISTACILKNAMLIHCNTLCRIALNEKEESKEYLDYARRSIESINLLEMYDETLEEWNERQKQKAES